MARGRRPRRSPAVSMFEWTKSRVVPRAGARSAAARVRRAPTAPAIESSPDPGPGAAVPAPVRRRPGLLAAALLVAACNPQVQGNGVYREETRAVDPFNGVFVGDGVATHVTAGSAQGVRVIGDSNLLQYVETHTDPVPVGTTTVQALRIWVTQSYDATIPLSVAITVPVLSYAHAQDGAQVEVKKAAVASMRVEGAGGGAVTLIGPGGAFLDVDLASASLDAGYYPVAAAYVELIGASRAELDSAGPVTGLASGTSVVDNTLASGPCYVVTTGAARTSCN